MNTLINFELAKLLKEKGFDEPTLLCYDKCDMLASYAETVFKPKNYNTSGYVKSAPTIAEVIMWLYEKHGIWIYSYKVEPFVYEDIPYPKYVWISKCDEKFVDTDNGLAVNHYNSPIEAYEAAIEYTLNNLT